MARALVTVCRPTCEHPAKKEYCDPHPHKWRQDVSPFDSDSIVIIVTLFLLLFRPDLGPDRHPPNVQEVEDGPLVGVRERRGLELLGTTLYRETSLPL